MNITLITVLQPLEYIPLIRIILYRLRKTQDSILRRFKATSNRGILVYIWRIPLGSFPVSSRCLKRKVTADHLSITCPVTRIQIPPSQIHKQPYSGLLKTGDNSSTTNFPTKSLSNLTTAIIIDLCPKTRITRNHSGKNSEMKIRSLSKFRRFSGKQIQLLEAPIIVRLCWEFKKLALSHRTIKAEKRSKDKRKASMIALRSTVEITSNNSDNEIQKLTSKTNF
ncbi:hypothetical protein SISSUDRAFT_89219 [Sistotremastrum suecicum HHB10207 ss-3]|uniref:Uncharacterized protein n=1 Tax=Sistotremastrum suecicum HHB10207 ss-3 TaxID=1314776 RepID=A0A166B9U9_9AGAM|nr:hypothetical protein SISSUDRAFT_89219 [Sistotremastrum suecicum HHB10207 ss-3]